MHSMNIRITRNNHNRDRDSYIILNLSIRFNDKKEENKERIGTIKQLEEIAKEVKGKREQNFQ